jgi:DNA-binding XRE family transcriptional regulator
MTTTTPPGPAEKDPDAWYFEGRSMSRSEAARVLGVSVETVNLRARAGLIRRKNRRYSAEDVERLVYEQSRNRRTDVRQDGLAIKWHRKRRGWTQLDLAVEAGLQETTISAAENHRRSTRHSILLRIARALRVDVAEISHKQ